MESSTESDLLGAAPAWTKLTVVENDDDGRRTFNNFNNIRSIDKSARIIPEEVENHSGFDQLL